MYAFYDFETTGTSTAFDQPLQFAAVLTDKNFKEIQKVEFRCRLSPHILPDPYALFITGIKIERLLDKKNLSLYEMSKNLNDLIQTWSPCIWIGYNSIRFDELVLRQLFYQNLQANVYATQINGNSRLDILTLMHSAFVYDKCILKWPRKSNGTYSFKLDELAPFNGFNEHRAHDALGDVRATIFLAKLVRERNPLLWENYLKCNSKQYIRSLLNLKRPLSLCLRLSSLPPKQFIVYPCGRNKLNQNQIGLLDLEKLSRYKELRVNQIYDCIEADPSVLIELQVNAAPYLSTKMAFDNNNLPETIFEESHGELDERVSEYITRRNQKSSAEYLEWQIYDRFYSSRDTKILEEIRSLSTDKLKQKINEISDERLRKLGLRVLLWEAPEALSSKQRKLAFELIVARWNRKIGEKVPWVTFDKVRAQLEILVSGNLISVAERNQLASFYKDRLIILKKLLC